MNRKLLKIQLLASGVLSIMLLAEWSYGELGRRQLQALLDKQTESDYQAEELPELDMPEQNAEHFSNIVERPLFMEGRKPLAESAPADAQQTVDNGQIDDWLLIGIYNKDKRPMALFRKQNEAKKYLKLSQDQTIAGWQLQQIQSDRVTLQQGGQQKIVMLRKPRAQIKPPVPVANRLAPPPAKPVQPVPPPVAPANNNPPENSNDDT